MAEFSSQVVYRMLPLTIMLFLQCGIAYAAEFSSRREGAVLYYTGKLTEASVAVIRDFITTKGEALIIDSEGGDVVAGISVGKLLFSNDVKVVVPKYCISSCANYIFLGARRKILLDGAILGFHGAPLRDKNFSDKSNNLINQKPIDQIANESTFFFKIIGVDTDLISRTYNLTKADKPVMDFELSKDGILKKYSDQGSAVEALAECLRKKRKCSMAVRQHGFSENKLYFPSLQAMKNAGARGIEAYPYPENRAAMSALAKNLGENVELIGDFQP